MEERFARARSERRRKSVSHENGLFRARYISILESVLTQRREESYRTSSNPMVVRSYRRRVRDVVEIELDKKAKAKQRNALAFNVNITPRNFIAET